MNNTSNPIRESAQNTNYPIAAGTEGPSTDHNNVLDKTERKSNSNQEKDVFDGKSQVTEVLEGKSQVNQTAIDDGTVTIVHNTESLPISEFVIDMNRTNDTLSQAQNDQKTKTWLERGKTSLPAINQVDQMQPTQAQWLPQLNLRSEYPPGQQGYQGNPSQGYPPSGYPSSGYPGRERPPGYAGRGRLSRYQQEDNPRYPRDEFQAIPYDPKTRNRFVTKAMLIVMIMLIITALCLMIVMSNYRLIRFFRSFGCIILIIGTLGLMGANMAIMFVAATRQMPLNIVILALGVFCMTCIGAVITARYRSQIVIYAALATAGVTLVCIGLACTSFDFTKWQIYIVVISAGFSVLAVILLMGMMLMGIYMKPLFIAILAISVVIQSVVLVLELQLILGGKTVELGEDEWAIASFMLYTSIVDIFLKLVQLIGLA